MGECTLGMMLAVALLSFYYPLTVLVVVLFLTGKTNLDIITVVVVQVSFLSDSLLHYRQ